MPPDTNEYEEACRDLDKSLTFGDIPITERLNKIEIPFELEPLNGYIFDYDFYPETY